MLLVKKSRTRQGQVIRDQGKGKSQGERRIGGEKIYGTGTPCEDPTIRVEAPQTRQTREWPRGEKTDIPEKTQRATNNPTFAEKLMSYAKN